MVVITGDELLRGRINDRNLALVARALEPLGGRVVASCVVGDRSEEIAAAVRQALDEGVDLVAVTGGLGPTHDDLSMDGVARALRRELWVDPAALAMVSGRTQRMAASARAREAAALKQATLPRGAVVLPPIGTAPGAAVHDGDAIVVVLPGPPWELEAMLATALADGPLRDLGGGPRPSVIARIFGVPESRFAEALREVDPSLRDDLEIGVCARDWELEVTVRGEAADDLVTALANAFGDNLYSRDGRGLDEVVAEGLRIRGQTLAVAESCTGGLLGARLTSRAGSSDFFLGGVVAYENAAKARLLGVPEAILATEGAVSEATAEAMAVGARALLGADWALSVTGIAGPGGGTTEKPVGLVYLACARPDGTVLVDELRLGGTRERIRDGSAALALQRLRRELIVDLSPRR